MDGIEECSFDYRESLNETLQHEPQLLSETDLTICEFNISGFQGLLTFIKENKAVLLLTTYTSEQSTLFSQALEYSPQISGFAIDNNETHSFRSAYRRMMRLKERSTTSTEYCRIRSDYFLNFKKVVCDVYLKISDEKFVKIIPRHQEYDAGEIEKYQRKNVTFLYIKDIDYKIFINAVSNFFVNRSKENLPQIVSNNNILPTICHETVHEIVSKIGLNEQALTLTNHALNEAFSLIEKNDIFKLLKNTLHQNSFISELSMLTSYISCAVCKESELKGPENYLRLSLASFFADISLKDDELARVESSHELESSVGSEKTRKIIRNHPLESAKMIERIDGLPIGVDSIIMKHHERYDGSGFPRGIDYTRIEPISALFIISSELAYTLYDTGYNRDVILDKIIDMEEKYTKGSFIKCIRAMKIAFSIPQVEYKDKEGLF